ncbi:putative porin [Frigoriflavimonas asaccharolytica]|uniref:Beta-barrel porin n=1 Tax=Frigoriflavimonas asaccharolytica TaxID=2735899 RepID=A0A8J8G7G2_9FLAO|nr:putative porin [Frigoriflavimonas asaccharolytica]NRS92696.1 hypothetical protein [Frigoriflavimonas asaccharolytica]
MKYFILILTLWSTFASAQVINKTDSNRVRKNDSLVIDSGTKDSLKIFKPTIQDYKFRTQFSEKKILDTVLSKNKVFIYTQYNNEDDFGLLQFANVGSGYNPLVYKNNDEANLALLPENKAYNILSINDVKYYDVKTPTTSFIYHSGVNNGAVLQTTYTQNIGDRINFAVEYFGLRSAGNFQRTLAANNTTLFSGNYISKNKKFEAFAHFIHQNINNEESGGIENGDSFLSDNTATSNRISLLPNLVGSNSQFAYRRYYFSSQFTPFNSEKYPFRIRYTVYHQTNRYQFGQESAEAFYLDTNTDALQNYVLGASKFSKNFSNTVSLVFDNAKFKLDGGLRYQKIKLGVSDPITINNIEIGTERNENRIGAVGNLGIFLWDKIDLKSNLEFSNGTEFGTFFKSSNNLKLEPIKDYFINAKVNFQTASPSFNYLVNTSIFTKFNYQNTDFKNENRTEIGGSLQLKWFQTELFANYFRVENFTYFDNVGIPKQSQEAVNIAQFGGDATFSYKKFKLNTRLQFQNTLNNEALFPAPDVVARANVFYQTKAFKDAAEIQTGIKAYYFTKFDSREFFPVLNEFILPGSSPFSIGGQPIVDAYFNMKVKRFFVFLEGQHINTLLIKNETYSAPNYPYTDFRINIGIVWYLIN